MSREQCLFDVSVALRPGMPVYPGDPEVDLSLAASQAAGEVANVSQLCCGLHSGTHVDVPFHVDSSWPTFAEVPLAALLGPARVVALNVAGQITAAQLAGLAWQGVERVLFKTRNSELWEGEFRRDFVSMALDAARFLVERTRVRLVGIDYLSIEAVDSPDLGVHRTLLGRGVLILEGLCLSGVEPGDYELLCLPLKTSAPDGAPVRAVLLGR